MQLFPYTPKVASPAGPRILIVEDQAPIALHLGMLMQKWGYGIAGWAVSGNQALDEIQYYPPDLVIVNYKLQGDMNGLELVGRIQARWHIPVLFFSGIDRRDLPSMLFQRQKVQFLAKPIQPRQLQTSLSQMLA